MARALAPHGTLITLEIDPNYAQVAQANIARAGLAASVIVRVRPALATLPQLASEDYSPFDLFFIDDDKANNADYLHGQSS